MNEPRFSEGQTIRIIPLPGADAFTEAQLRPYIGKTGTITSVWCRTRDEMPELSKMVVYPDVWCCDVRLDDGTVVRGVPDVALEKHFERGGH